MDMYSITKSIKQNINNLYNRINVALVQKVLSTCQRACLQVRTFVETFILNLKTFALETLFLQN